MVCLNIHQPIDPTYNSISIGLDLWILLLTINTRNLVSRLNFTNVHFMKLTNMCRFYEFMIFMIFMNVRFYDFNWIWIVTALLLIWKNRDSFSIINCLEFPVYGLGFSPWCPAWFTALMEISSRSVNAFTHGSSEFLSVV